MAVVGSVSNPLDVVAELAAKYKWPIEREEAEISFPAESHSGNYAISYSLVEGGDLNLACSFDLDVPEEHLLQAQQLVLLANGLMWRGHFDFWPGEKQVVYRIVLILGDQYPTPTQCHLMLASGMEACELYRPVFELVAKGVSADRAMRMGYIDPKGTEQ